jgi:hypothetical protein
MTDGRFRLITRNLFTSLINYTQNNKIIQGLSRACFAMY